MTCTACVNGWVELDGTAYAELQYPIPAGATPEETAAVLEKRARVSVSMVVRPCGDCRPQQLERWAAGCFRSEHRSSGCDLCLEAMGERAAQRHDRGN